ncbi:MAG: zinc ribbon domain-containing protein [Actinomycetota bacterium]|nr:zinc ribbon domain-containing protein [Actinomycetota bacterium]
MPTYDLTCQDCGESFERFMMRLIRDEDRVCPGCGSDNVKQGLGGGFLGGGTKTSDTAVGCGGGGFS